MSDDGVVKNAVSIISCLTRNNIDWGTLSFRVWKTRHDLSVLESVWLAKELLANKQLEEITEFDIREV